MARNVVPEDIVRACGDSPLPAWRLLEEGVYFFFRTILMLETIRLGGDCLFQRQPEGVVLAGRHPNPCALLYECKARAKPYRISSDDVLRYTSYIRAKRTEVQFKYHLHLSHFIIVSSGFSGDVGRRVEEIGADGTVVSLLPARELADFSEVAQQLPFPDLHLLDLRQLFCRGVVSGDHLRSCAGPREM